MIRRYGADMIETPSPLDTFNAWYALAQAHEHIKEPTAMTLATATEDGRPSARIVLMKGHDASGVTFFTNYEGRKSREITANPHSALVFYWMPLDKQIRIEGTIAAVPEEESDAYFASRGRGKQLGAWASMQSERMNTQHDLQHRTDAMEARFADEETIPRPPHWGGWKLTPTRYEFWEQKEFRLHDRWEYVLENGVWIKHWLYP